jgi:hypothetical protein
MSALVTALHGPKDRTLSRRAEGLAWIAAGLFGSPPSSRRGSLSQRGAALSPDSNRGAARPPDPLRGGPRDPDPRPSRGPTPQPQAPGEMPPESPIHTPMPEHIPAGDPPQKRELSDRGY